MLTYADAQAALRRGGSREFSRFYRHARMLTYADVCWRMLTYADVQAALRRGLERSRVFIDTRFAWAPPGSLRPHALVA
jgi:hypothetical protein